MTSPIGNNPQIPPISGPTGPSRAPGSQRRSVDAAQARPWQTSVPLMKGAPSVLDLSALRDLTTHLAETDEGFATPMVLLAARIEESDNQKLLRNFSAFRQELFAILTPEALRGNPEYLEAYRKFLGRYRECSLCSSVTLKNSQGNEAAIDKLLICAASPVIAYAFETGWAECKVGIYLSDELNEDFFAAVVGYIKTGVFLEAPDSLDRVIARYTAARSLEMQDVIRYCQTVLCARPQPIQL
ncbi:MAG: BTB/POZ domain-containing protein, partial [Parachlamydia sp.]|nr:BTB/POZ domain-containing protein [Parachlamydia sp.]